MAAVRACLAPDRVVIEQKTEQPTRDGTAAVAAPARWYRGPTVARG
jgi:hypothetical protein